MNNNLNNHQVLFQPTFGTRPVLYIGRDKVIEQFMNGLKEPIGSRNRCTLFLGQRGMGKTALLLELSERAQNAGYVVARVTAGALGFSFGLTFSDVTERQYGFRAKMSLLCDRLAEKDLGALILIDEVRTSAAMREVASAYQELVGDQKNIAIAMAGLPYAVSGVLNDKVLTFLNRATKVELGLISTNIIRAFFDRAFRSVGLILSDALLDRASYATRGFPYLMQLIGYYLIEYTPDNDKVTEAVLRKAERAAMNDLDDNVFKPILNPLSENDRIFLCAMARCEGNVSTSKLQAKLGNKGPAIQPYRKRLLEAGVIEAPRRGELVFAVPFLRDYLLTNQ